MGFLVYGVWEMLADLWIAWKLHFDSFGGEAIGQGTKRPA